MIPNLKKPQILQEKIAVLLIGGAFVIILAILAIHSYDTGIVLNNLSNPTTEQLQLYREINNSNLNVFSIIFSLFGAWVGAVLAFYFGSQSLEKAFNSLTQAQSSIDKIVSDNRLAGIKVEEIISKNPDSRALLKFKLEDKINKIVKDAEERSYSFVMVTEAAGNQILGLLFIVDLTGLKSKADLVNLDETLEKFITDNEVKDTVTKMRWTKEGLKNYVIASMDDSLKTVVDRMKQLNDSLSVRAVVTENGVPVATITYDMVSKELRK